MHKKTISSVSVAKWFNLFNCRDVICNWKWLKWDYRGVFVVITKSLLAEDLPCNHKDGTIPIAMTPKYNCNDIIVIDFSLYIWKSSDSTQCYWIKYYRGVHQSQNVKWFWDGYRKPLLQRCYLDLGLKQQKVDSIDHLCKCRSIWICAWEILHICCERAGFKESIKVAYCEVLCHLVWLLMYLWAWRSLAFLSHFLNLF